MYRIYCDNVLIYDPRDDLLQIIEGKITLDVNSTGTLEVELPSIHSQLSEIKKIVSIIEVYDDQEVLFTGRVLSSEASMDGVVLYTCEGEMAYLLDSIQRPKSYHNLTPQSYLQDKLEQHNSQVEDSKRFTLGVVEKQSMNYDARQDNQYTNTLETIMDKLVNSNGGYIRVRHLEGGRYLDYLESYGRVSGQTIRFGENILDLTEHISAEGLITVLIPLGKPPEGAADGSKLTIASANNGKDYLEDTEAIALYGRITGTHTWEDVTIPENLKRKGEEYLKNARNLSLTIELTAIDLHMVDVDIDRIKLGDMVRVVSAPHGIDRYMLVSKREYNLVDPSQDKIVLGDTLAALTEKQAVLLKNAERQEDASSDMEGIKGSINVMSEEMTTAKENISALNGRIQVTEESSTLHQQELQSIKNSINALSSSDEILSKNVQEVIKRLEKIEEKIK